MDKRWFGEQWGLSSPESSLCPRKSTFLWKVRNFFICHMFRDWHDFVCKKSIYFCMIHMSRYLISNLHCWILFNQICWLLQLTFAENRGFRFALSFTITQIQLNKYQTLNQNDIPKTANVKYLCSPASAPSPTSVTFRCKYLGFKYLGIIWSKPEVVILPWSNENIKYLLWKSLACPYKGGEGDFCSGQIVHVILF